MIVSSSVSAAYCIRVGTEASANFALLCPPGSGYRRLLSSTNPDCPPRCCPPLPPVLLSAAQRQPAPLGDLAPPRPLERLCAPSRAEVSSPALQRSAGK